MVLYDAVDRAVKESFSGVVLVEEFFLGGKNIVLSISPGRESITFCP